MSDLDLATIGVSFDTTGLEKGQKAFDNTVNSAGRAADAADRAGAAFTNASQRTAAAAATMSGGTDKVKQSVDGANEAVARFTIGQEMMIEKMREQAATVGMSRSQLMAYQAAQMGVTDQVKDAIGKMQQYEQSVKDAAKAKADAAKNADVLTQAIKLMGAAYAALKIADFVKDSAMMAARYETLGVAMTTVGRTAGYTKVQMETATQAIAAQGITMLESRASAIKLVQAHVDLTNASKLARIAQDAAVIGNINSSEAFERLVNGISRGNVLILRNIGINVNLQAAYQQMAESLGKSTKELTENERVQARLNAVMERGTDIAGTYESAMGTAGKQILSMQRYVDDLKTKFGATFNEVLTISVMAVTEQLKNANGEITELAKNDQLEAWGHAVAQVFVGIANAASNATTVMQKVALFAAHQSEKQEITDRYKAQAKELNKNRGFFDLGTTPGMDRLNAARDAELAESDAGYTAQQAALSATFDRFNRSADQFYAARKEKQQKDAAERLAVDQDYAAKSEAVMKAYAGYSLEVQQAAQAALAKNTYYGTPSYRDSPGREDMTGQDDRAKRLEDSLVREQTAFASEKSIYDARQKMLEEYHSKLGLDDDSFYAGRNAARAEYIAAEAVSFAKESALIKAFKAETPAEVAANQTKYDELVKQHQKFVEEMRNDGGADMAGQLADQAKYYDGVMNAVNKAGDAEVKKLDEQIARQREHNAEIGKTKDQIEATRQAQSNASLEAIQVEDDAIRAALQNSDLDDVLKGKDREIYAARLAFLDQEILKRQAISSLLAQGAVLEANAKAADDAAKAWAQTAKKVEDDLTAAIVDGGGKGWKKLIRDMEIAFARLVLRPILQPFAQSVSSIANPTASQAADAVGSAGLSAGGGMIGAANAASNVYKMISGGLGGLSGTIADTAQGAMYQMGLTNQIASNGAFANGVGVAGSTATGYLAGSAINSAISGQYSTGSGMMTVEKVATAVASYFGPQFGALAGAISGLVNRAFGMGSKDVTDTGISGTISASGTTGSSYTAWHQSGGWFRSDKNGKDSTAFDTATINSLNSGLATLQASATAYAANLGVTSDAIANYSKTFDISFGKNGADAATKITKLMGEISDDLANKLVPNLADFVQQGETASATLQRLSGEFDTTNKVAMLLGKTAEEVFGSAGMSSAKVRESIVSLAGGASTLLAQAQSFATNYLSDAEKLAPVQKAVDAAMSAMGLSSVKTREQFKKLVLGLDLTTDAGQKEYVQLMSIADAFAQVYTATTDVIDATTGLTEAQQKLVDDVTTARDAVSNAFDAQSSALNSTITNLQNFTKTIRAFKESLLVGNLSTLSPEQQYQQTKAKFDKTYSMALAGDPEAQSGLQQAAQDFLTASKEYYGSNQAYARDFNKVQGALNSAANAADTQVAVAQQQLDEMRKMVSGILKLDASTTTLSEAIQQYFQAYGAATAGGVSQGSLRSAVGSSSANAIQSLYTDLFHRTADTAGLHFWQGKLESGTSWADIRNAMMGSDEYINGSHASGIERVPFDGYRAVLHKDETVLTAQQSKGNAEMLQILRDIRSELQADKAQRGAAAEQTLTKLDEVSTAINKTNRAIRANA